MFTEFNDIKLTRLQLFVWTWISITIYLLNFISIYSRNIGSIFLVPDIDSTLVILTGLSIAGYLGGKMVTSAPMSIYRIIEEKEDRTFLLILGLNFGYYVGMVLIDNRVIGRQNLIEWTNNRIVVDIPKVTEIKEGSVLEVLRGDNISTTYHFENYRKS
jgi:hypothetical protein